MPPSVFFPAGRAFRRKSARKSGDVHGAAKCSINLDDAEQVRCIEILSRFLTVPSRAKCGVCSVFLPLVALSPESRKDMGLYVTEFATFVSGLLIFVVISVRSALIGAMAAAPPDADAFSVGVCGTLFADLSTFLFFFCIVCCNTVIITILGAPGQFTGTRVVSFARLSAYPLTLFLGGFLSSIVALGCLSHEVNGGSNIVKWAGVVEISAGAGVMMLWTGLFSLSIAPLMYYHHPAWFKLVLAMPYVFDSVLFGPLELRAAVDASNLRDMIAKNDPDLMAIIDEFEENRS